MERTTDWKGPAALILAGLALLVALSGRGGFSFLREAQPQSIIVNADRAVPSNDLFDPNSPGDQAQPIPDPKVPQGKPVFPVMPNFKDIPAGPLDLQKGSVRLSLGSDDNPVDSVGSYIKGLVAYLSPLFQWAALGLLIWLGYRYLTQRNRPRVSYVAAPPPPPQVPPAPPNLGDIMRPESGQQD